MILDDGVFVADYVFMAKAFKYIYLLFDGPDMLFADVYFLHGDEDPVVEVDAFVDLAIGSFSNLFDKLVAFDGLGFR